MFITFGTLNKKCLLFIIVPLSALLRLWLVPKSQNKNIFLHTYLKFITRFLNFIPWIIFNKNNSTTSSEISQNKPRGYSHQDSTHCVCLSDLNTQSKAIPIYREERSTTIDTIEIKIKNNETNKKIKYIFLLLLIGILDFIAVNLNSIISFTKIYNEKTTGVISTSLTARLFIIILLSYFILSNEKLNKSHYFSIIIILIMVILINVQSFFIENNGNYFFIFLAMFIPEFIYSLMYVLGAKYIILTQGNIYKLLCFNGVIGMILSMLLQFILSYINCAKYEKYFLNFENFCYEDHFRTMFNSLELTSFFDFLFMVLIIIINLVQTISIWLTIFYFSVNHFGAIYSIPLFYQCFIDQSILQLNIWNIILYIFGSLIIIFMSFVYNKIIILKFFGMEKDDNQQTDEDSRKDSLIIPTSNDPAEFTINGLDSSN